MGRLPGFSLFLVRALSTVLILSCAPLSAQRRGSSQSGQNTTTQPDFAIAGKVFDKKDHAQLENVRVELRTFTGATVETVVTRSGGDFEFLRVGVGSYDLIVQQAGYQTASQRLDVQESFFGLSIELIPILGTSSAPPGLPPVSTRELSIPKKARDAMEKGLASLNEKSGYQQSIKQFERAIQYFPGYYEAYTQIGIAQMHLRDNVSAEPALRKALDLSQGQYAEALLWLATLLNDSQRFADAEPIARKGLELASVSWEMNAQLARSLLGLHRTAEAEKYALAAAKLQPDYALLYLILANVHSQAENAPAILEDLNNYLRLAPTGPMADKARAQQEKLKDELANSQKTTTVPVSGQEPPESGANQSAIVAWNKEDSPILSSAEPNRKPVLWPPPNVDADIPAVAVGVACPLQQVVKGARQRVQELLDNLDRFTATEVIDSSEFGRDGRASQSLRYTFNYLAAVSLSRDGDLRYEESRQAIGRGNSTPIPIRTVGLAVGAAIFHPLRVDDFEITCEGLGWWHDQPAWQLRFGQRADKPSRFQAVLDNGNWYDVKLKGRAWVSKQTSQIEHIDFDLVDAISPIRLQTEHMSLDYNAVEFPKRKLQLWLPESASFYIDIGGHRYLNRHELSNYVLFAVDTTQKIQEPRKPE